MNNLKEMRIKKGLTQAQLAERVGVKQNTIANYEAGIRMPRMPHLRALAEVFESTIDALLGGKSA